MALILLGGCSPQSDDAAAASDAAADSPRDTGPEIETTSEGTHGDETPSSMPDEIGTDETVTDETTAGETATDPTTDGETATDPTTDDESGSPEMPSPEMTAADPMDAAVTDATSDDSTLDDPTTEGGAPVERGTLVFDRDRLHIVSISVAPEDLPALDEHSDTRVPATLTFDDVVLGEVGVRNKGQTSFQPVSGKPGFSVKFDEFVAGQKLDGLRKLMLNNTTQDPTWCNETLTYETYRRAGLPAPRIAFAVVTLNGEPKGIYSIGEAVNEQFLSRHYGKDMNHGNLYEGPWDFSDSVDIADLKDEDEGRLRDDLRELQAIVQSEPDEGFAERLAERLDVDQFLLGYAIDAVTVAWDGYAYDAWNYYLYDHPADGRFLFLPAGANWPYFRDAPDAAPSVDPRVLVSLWGGGKDPASFLAGARVQRIASLDERFEAMVRDVSHDVFDVPALHADFDRIDAVLHSATDPDDATLRDLEIFDTHVQLAYDFVQDRKAYLLEQFPR